MGESFVVVHHVDGPKVRLGALWFVALLAAAAVDRLALAALLAAASALAADQLMRGPGHDPPTGAGDPDGAGERQGLIARFGRLAASGLRLPVIVGAAALPLAAAAGAGTLTAALAAVVVALFVYALASSPAEPLGGETGLDQPDRGVGSAILFVWAAGLAGAAPVLAHRLGVGVAVVLVLLVSAYDAGDFLVGTGAARAWEGVAAGLVALAVATFALAVVPPGPLDTGDVVVLGAVAGALVPLGPPAASVLVGDGHRPARFVRRIDSLLVVGPVWAYAAAALLTG